MEIDYNGNLVKIFLQFDLDGLEEGILNVQQPFSYDRSRI